MKIDKVVKEPFAVIGKVGSTEDGAGFIDRLWNDANANFAEVQALTVKDENGIPVGVWGAMSDLAGTFHPWEDDFTRGLYLAGVECEPDAEAPAGWTKWIIPGFEYLRAEREEATFRSMLAWMAEQGLKLAGAVQECTVPAEGKQYLYFPIRRL